MRWMSWLREGQTGGVNKPLLRTRLTLGTLDERIVPDGSGLAPPYGPPGQPSEQTTSSPTQVGTEQTVYVGQFGSYNLYASNANGGNWFTLVDPTTGVFTSVLMDYDPSQVQVPDAATTSYQPDANKWTLVWDTATGTWTGLPPGSTNVPAGRGMLDGSTNVVYTDSSSSAGGQTAVNTAAPGNGGGVRASPFTITPTPDGRGITITGPGGSVTIRRTDVNGPPRYQVLIEPSNGGGPYNFQFPPVPPGPPWEPPLAPPKKPPVIDTSAVDA